MNSSPPPRHGVLLINIGSPATLSLRDVAVYLRKFLSDRRVIDINPALRFLLVNFLIVPFRTRKARQAYSKIWRNDGSPLLAFSHACQRALNAKLPAHITTAVAMRYSQPDIATAVAQLCAQNISQLTIMPLFPQYSSAANGSAIAASLQAINQQANIPRLQAINCFYDQPFYQQALGDVIATHLQKNKKIDFLLFSYHGLPQRQLPCHATPDCCAAATASNQLCYRRHCLQTTQAAAERLQLPASFYTTAFQSRLAGTPWIKPWSDVEVKKLARQGIQHLAVVCPSFVADCLETLEEVGMRLRDDFIHAGGKELTLIPCLNASPAWVDALCDFLQKTTFTTKK